MQRRLLVTSFDAIGTLVQVKGSVGHQYHTALHRFLEERGKLGGPPALHSNEANMAVIARESLTAVLRHDRQEWAANEQQRQQQQQLEGEGEGEGGSGGSSSSSSSAPVPEVNPREMPIGGLTECSVYGFWLRVLLRTYHDPRLWAGASDRPLYDITVPRSGVDSSTIQPPLSELGIPDAEWEKLFHHLIDEVFATPQGYYWLPEGLRTLQELCKWSSQQQQQKDGGETSMLVPAALPFVVTNSDSRMANVMRDLGAYSLGVGRAPILGDVISAMDVGRGKPSPRGLERCLELAGITSEEDRQRVVHIHVGDAPEDAAACAAARHQCHHVPCDIKVGVRWEDLLAKIQELQ